MVVDETKSVGVPFFQNFAINTNPLVSRPATYTSFPEIKTADLGSEPELQLADYEVQSFLKACFLGLEMDVFFGKILLLFCFRFRT